jgi:hypothetical protein
LGSPIKSPESNRLGHDFAISLETVFCQRHDCVLQLLNLSNIGMEIYELKLMLSAFKTFKSFVEDLNLSHNKLKGVKAGNILA